MTIVENQFYRIEIAKDETFTPGSVDNKPYDLILNPREMEWTDYYKTLSIQINSDNNQKHIALVGCMWGADVDVAVLTDDSLIVVMGDSLTVIDCFTLTVKLNKKISENELCFSIHKFDNGFIIYGELEIIKLSSDFEIEWTFTGADIFVTLDASCPFYIDGDMIYLTDFNGKKYIVNKYGKVISEEQAMKRFNKLWENEGNKLLSGDIIPSVMEKGEICPVDYCISTIARLIHQPSGGEIVGGIRRRLSSLFEAADPQFVYPDESLHVSLLGCTQREAKVNVFDRDRVNKIRDICIQEIKKKEPTEIILRGIGIVGNQIFIQGIPVNRNWEELRMSMNHRLVNSGETPISYEDKSPIHINIIRIVNSNRDFLVSLHKVISQMRDVELGSIKLKTVEFVITDFCVSKNNVVWLDEIECCGSLPKQI